MSANGTCPRGPSQAVWQRSSTATLTVFGDFGGRFILAFGGTARPGRTLPNGDTLNRRPAFEILIDGTQDGLHGLLGTIDPTIGFGSIVFAVPRATPLGDLTTIRRAVLTSVAPKDHRLSGATEIEIR